MEKNKRGMVQQLSVIAYSLVGLAIMVGIGLVVLSKFAANAPEANSTLQYMMTQLGSTGLAGWIPSIIAILIGIWALSYFFGGKGKKAY